MAKRPEDRFSSYDDLIEALDDAPLDWNRAKARGSRWFPSIEEPEPAPPASHDETTAGSRSATNPRAVVPTTRRIRSSRSPTWLPISMRTFSRNPRRGSLRSSQPRRSCAGPRLKRMLRTPTRPTLMTTQSTPPSRAPGSVTVWILSSAILGVACILLGIGLVQFLGVAGGRTRTRLSTDPDAVLDLNRGIEPLPRSSLLVPRPVSGRIRSQGSSPPRNHPALERKRHGSRKRIRNPLRSVPRVRFSNPRPDPSCSPSGHEPPFPIGSRGRLSWCVGSSNRAIHRSFPTLHMALDSKIGRDGRAG